MPYRLRYQAFVDFVPAGRGIGLDQATGLGPGMTGGPAQTLGFFDAVNATSTTFTATDITALLLAMSNDLSAQMNVSATLTRVQAMATGGG
jgi:hypothetical protein